MPHAILSLRPTIHTGTPAKVIPTIFIVGVVKCTGYHRAGNDKVKCGSFAKIVPDFGCPFFFIVQQLLPLPLPRIPKRERAVSAIVPIAAIKFCVSLF